MSSDEIKALEQRLSNAGCYTGAIDGIAGGALAKAIETCPDQRPFLRIETGMHAALMRGVGVDAACRLLATPSLDKTIRLWSLPDGKLKKVFRLPIGDGDSGKVYATALSPDGRWLVAGGTDAAFDKLGKNSLTVIDLSTGAIRRLGAFEVAIPSIAISADGRRVGVGLYGKSGVRVLDVATGTELLADRKYGDSVYGLAFTPDGEFITSSDDGQLRRYGPDLKLTVKRAGPDGKDPFTVAVDPSGRRVAVSYYDEATVSILDARTLAPIAKAETSDISDGDFRSIAWSRDGATIVAGGEPLEKFRGKWRSFLRRFDTTGRRRGTDTEVGNGTFGGIVGCGEGFIFDMDPPSFGLLTTDGVATLLEGPRTVDMRSKLGAAFAVSPDAYSVRFGLGAGDEKPVIFNLRAASLTDSMEVPSDFVPAKVDGLPVKDVRDSYAPKLRGATLALDPYEHSRALAIRPDASGFAVGAEWSVRAYDVRGKERWRRDAPGDAWGVDFAAKGEIVVVAYGDGTIRWLRWQDGGELVALFVEPQTRNWVAWTPSGYYMASPGGERLIGWHLNRG